MQFNAVVARQFFSHVESRLRLANRGLVLLTGTVVGRTAASSNGAGKTSLLLDAPLYALFGRTLRGARGDDVVRQQAGKNCLVQLSLTTDAGEAVWIQRPQRHAHYPKPSITICGETYTGAAEVERIVSDVLGLSFGGVTNSLFLGKGSAYFTQLTDAARKELLEELLGLEDLTRCAAVVAARQQQLAAGLEVARRTLEGHQHASRAYREAVQTLQRQAEDFVRHAAAQNETVQAHAQEAARRVHEAEEAVRALALREPSSTECESARTVYQRASAWFERTQAAHQALRVVLATRAAEHDRLQRELDRLASLSGECPTCLQSIREVHLERCQTELKAQVCHMKTLIAGVDGAVFDFQPVLEAARRQAEQARTVFEALQACGALWQQQQQAAQQALRVEQERVRAVEEQQAAMAAQGQVDSTHVESARRRWEQEEAAVQTATERVQQLEDYGKFLDFWERAFGNSGIKHRVLASVIPFLNAQAAYYSQALTDGTTVVEFATETALKTGALREKFDVQVRALDAGGSYTVCSDGQRRRADLICTLALGDLVNTRARNALDLLVVDEILDGLDPVGIERLLQLFSQMTSVRSSIWCVSHNQRLAAHFPTVVNVVQEQGISHVWEGEEEGERWKRSHEHEQRPPTDCGNSAGLIA